MIQHMTRSEQDYIKTIYSLGGDEKLISNKELSAVLGVSPPSVNEMTKRLGESGYLTLVPYKGTQLTEKGVAIAVQMIRRHRIWEVLLVEKLGYTWDEVHVEAEELEHVTTDLLEKRLYDYLGKPSYCPHGGLIPPMDMPLEKRRLYPLSQVKEGQVVTLGKVTDKKELLNYFIEIGLTLHEAYKVLKIEAFNGPITLVAIERPKKHILIGREAAHHIFVDGEFSQEE